MAGGSPSSVTLAGTSSDRLVWKPAPSQIRTACTSGASCRENSPRNALITSVSRCGMMIPVAGQAAAITHR